MSCHGSLVCKILRALGISDIIIHESFPSFYILPKQATAESEIGIALGEWDQSRERTLYGIERQLRTHHNFARKPPLSSIIFESLFDHSLMIFLVILPLASFGTSSTKETPPLSHLCFATRDAIHFCICSSVTFPSDSGTKTTYARGHSSPKLGASQSMISNANPERTYTVTPTTAASATSSFSIRIISSSAGETWNALTLISS